MLMAWEEVNLVNVNTLGEGQAKWGRLGGIFVLLLLQLPGTYFCGHKRLAGGLSQTQGLSKKGVS